MLLSHGVLTPALGMTKQLMSIDYKATNTEL